jgi:hypothetical protein
MQQIADRLKKLGLPEYGERFAENGRSSSPGASSKTVSWTGLILAPLLVPVTFSAVLQSSFQGDRPVLLFLLLLDLHRVLQHHDIPLPALPVSTLFVAANDKLQGLPAGTVAGCGGVRTADVVMAQEVAARSDRGTLACRAP